MPVSRLLLAGLLLLLAGCRDVPAPDDAPPWGAQPNILWLVAEDLSPVLPPFGDSTVATPTLSRLAAEGVTYPNVFSPSGVCAPSRAALATGLYPTAIGAMHMRTGPWWFGRPPDDVLATASHPGGLPPYEAMPPPEVRMHSEMLRRLGYYTANNRKEDVQFVAPVTAWDANGPDAHWRGRAPGQPFFAVFNFEGTHESRLWQKADAPLLVPDTLAVPVPPYLPDTEVGRRDLRRMYSNVVEMDAQVGTVLADLEADGLLDSTVVFWYSDHGGPLPRQKRSLTDAGLRAPLLVRFPKTERFPDGWRAGTTDERLVSFLDFLPALLELAGEPVPDHLHGQPVLAPDAPERIYVHAAVDRLDAHHDASRAVRDHRFKYLRHLHPERSDYRPLAYRARMATMQELLRLRDAGALTEAQARWFRPTKPAEELFDTQADPHELRNLADDPAYAAVLARLRGEYDRWAATVPDYGRIPEATYLAAIWPDGTQPVTASPEATWNGDTLTLISATEGASIGVQVLADGVPLGATWRVYTGPIAVPSGARAVATAHRIGYLPSDTVTARR